MNAFKKTQKALLSMLLALSLPLAGYAAPTPFTVTPAAIGEANAPFTATFVDFSYNAYVDQTAVAGVGTFSEQGAGFFGSFRHPDTATVVLGTGINSDYQLYAVFDGAGTVSPTGPTSLKADFSSFALEIWADPIGPQTTLTQIGFPNAAGDQDGFNFACGLGSCSNGAPAFTFGGTGDDILVARSLALLADDVNVNLALAAGDFDVILLMDGDMPLPAGDGSTLNDFFGGLPFLLGLSIGDFNGVNSLLEGFSGGNFVDGRITRSGNLSFEAIPEPGTLFLLGVSLIAFGVFGRRRLQGWGNNMA